MIRRKITAQGRFDLIYNKINPFLQAIIGASVFFTTFNFDYLQHKYPNWQHLFTLITHKSIYVLIATTSISFILSLIHKVWITPNITGLAKELNIAEEKNNIIANNIKNLFDGYLYHLIVDKLKQTQAAELRASLLVHNGENKFFLCGRFSGNPIYKKVNRSEYPDNQGCISQAWAHGWCFETNLTKKESNNKYNIPSEVYEKMNMKSKSYAAMQIKNNGKHIGVFVIESTKKKAFSEDTIKNCLEQEERMMAELVTQLRDYIPALTIAQEKGL